MPLLQVEDLTTYFYTRNGVVKAVEGVSFTVEKGGTLGIVGESGSGKSVSCYSLLGLIPQPPGKIVRGRAMFDGTDLLAASNRELRTIRGNRIAMIFQDPMTSLNPYLKVSTQLIEPLTLHRGVKKKEALAKAIAALKEVGIQDAERRIHFYPHEFSGGMRQRVMIAMAMIMEPELLIADEPTTALDVTVQAQIMDLIRRMQREHGTAVILITHDLGVVAGFCEKINVMYAGRIVESGPSDRIFYHPAHPYTAMLQRSNPSLQPKDQALFTIPGQPPDLSGDLSGDVFALRFPEEQRGDWRAVSPELKEVAPGHFAAASAISMERAKSETR